MAILVSGGKDNRPSPAEIADIHKVIQPEIERRGYVMAKSSGSADYFVYVQHPIDPQNIGRITFVRAEPRVPFLREHETVEERTRRENRTAIAEMVREPK